MSMSFYLNCPTVHSLPKILSRTKNILVGNGQYVGVLFVAPVVINLHGHQCEVSALVLEIHNNVDIVMATKNMYETEKVISTRDLCLHFLNSSMPFFPQMDILVKPREQRVIKIDLSFVDDISGLAISS